MPSFDRLRRKSVGLGLATAEELAAVAAVAAPVVTAAVHLQEAARIVAVPPAQHLLLRY